MPDRWTDDQAVDLLKLAAAYDNRQPSQMQATVWAADLSDAGVLPVDAAQAIRQHYRDRPDVYLKPGHVIAIAGEMRRARTANDGVREAIEAYDRPDAVNPRTVAPRILEMLAAARARVAARDAESHAAASEPSGEGCGHPRDRWDDLSGPGGAG
jgi:hypothetical protein